MNLSPPPNDLILLEGGIEQRITPRNERHFRHRMIQCSLCGVTSTFDALPHSCSGDSCINPFDSGKDVLLPGDFFWNDHRLRNSKVLVVGCGAVGNEVVKNLALAGVMHFTLIDFDEVEESNRARSVLFNEGSIGKSMEDSESMYKVDVMGAALKQIDPNIHVECIKKAIPDGPTQTRNRHILEGKRDGELREMLSIIQLERLCSEHDMAVIGTDGRAAAATFNRIAYPYIPQVRGAMNEHGTLSNLAVSLPYVTFCLECAVLNNAFGLTVLPPQDVNAYPKSEGLFDWSRWEEMTGLLSPETNLRLGRKACNEVAEAAGAQSFAHANAVIGAAMAAQALLILHGYPLMKENEGRWPTSVPRPLINEFLKLSTFLPDKNQKRSMTSGRYPDGRMHCGACEILRRSTEVMANITEQFRHSGYSSLEETPRFSDDANFWKPESAPPPVPPKSSTKRSV